MIQNRVSFDGEKSCFYLWKQPTIDDSTHIPTGKADQPNHKSELN